MKNKTLLFFSFVLYFFNISSYYSQKLWTKKENRNSLVENKELYQKKNFPSQYKILSLDNKKLKNDLKRKSSNEHIIKLPNEDGSLSQFMIRETSNFNKILQAKFPNIRAYSAQGIDDPTAVAKISLGTDGFHAVISSGKKETLYIDPYSKDKKDYIVYKKSSLTKLDEDFRCLVETTAKQELSSLSFTKNADDGKLRTFRLAIVCSGEYAQFHLNRQNIASTETDVVKKAAVLSAMNTSMSRINGVFEKDLSVKLELIANNDEIIFLDAASDNITDGNASVMINEVQNIIDTSIGSSNYDVGHIFSIGGSGLAGLGVVCSNGQKARGVTGIPSPVSDPYDIDYVAHELGHQFGATHTQNNDCNRTNSTAVEPGSGSTIMGYAGICNPNVIGAGPSTGNSDDHFHAISIEQMWNTIQSSANCAVLSDTNNSAPTANAGSSISIPKSTPFKLTGTATDADGMASLTYNWEQIDPEIGATMPPASTNAQGPMFRSLPSSISPTRYFPNLATVMDGSTSNTWEVVPSVARDMNFSFFVRDNHAGGGSSARDDISVTVIDTNPFLVTALGTAVSWDTGSTQTITWDKSTTDIAPINCSNVNVKLSTDGGITFPIMLLENTPNDGTENIVIPDNPTEKARIMVEAVDNIFYNVNNTNFTINSTEPTFIITNSSGDQIVCNSGNQTATYSLNFNFVNGFSETTVLSTVGEPAGSTVVFSPETINSDGVATLTISDLNNKIAQDYTITVTGSSDTKIQNIDLKLTLNTEIFNNLNLSSPEDGATGVPITDSLQWALDSNATSYDIEISTDLTFNNIVLSENVTTNSYTTSGLSGVTEYFWRVKPKNNCGEGDFTTPFSFTTTKPEYCASTFDLEADHILNVTFGAINNDSGNDTDDGYEDFTSISTKVLRGQTREIRVTLDTDGFQDHIFVFIDWNQDYVFDIATERYDLGTVTDDQGTAIFNIEVPNNANFGETRMRVIMEYDDPVDNYGEGPCTADHLTGYGETEDYTINVVQPVLNANNYTITSTNETNFNTNDGTLNIDINQEEFTYNIAVEGPQTNLTEIISVNNYNLTNLGPGEYDICITAVETNDTQCFKVIIEAAKVIIAPDNYAIRFTSESCLDQNDGSIELSIKQEEFSYQVNITGPETNVSQILTGFTYSVFDLVPGNYEVCIIVLESNQTDCYEFTIEESQPISLKAETNKISGKYAFKIKTGTKPYTVYLDNRVVKIVDEKEFEVSLKGGDKLEVKSSKECEGTFRMSLDSILLLQNPITEKINLLLPFDILDNRIEVKVFSANGKLVYKKFIARQDNNLAIPFKNYASGIYILKLSLENTKPLKIIKQ